MKSYILIGIGLLVIAAACKKSDSEINNIEKQYPWKILRSGASYNLNSVFFTDSLTGYAVGGTDGSLGMGIIIKTTDGGNKWSEQKDGRNCNELTSVFFIGETGYAVGYDNYSVDTNYYCKGTILKTVNGGENWVIQSQFELPMLSSVYFINADTGYAVGGGVVSTVDGGKNWIEHEGYYTMKLRSVFAVGKTVYATLENSNWYYANSIVKTTNGFETWDVKMGIWSSSLDRYITSLFFTDENTGYVGTESYNGVILQTTNGGVNWTKQKTGTTKDLYSIYFLNPNEGYAVGGDSYTVYNSSNLLDYTDYESSVILKTTDAGVTWEVQPTDPVKAILRSVFFVGNTGYAVGDKGTIIKTVEK
jgi:photosystem II stability/assembly factor-like uncharacterized protein